MHTPNFHTAPGWKKRPPTTGPVVALSLLLCLLFALLSGGCDSSKPAAETEPDQTPQTLQAPQTETPEPAEPKSATSEPAQPDSAQVEVIRLQGGDWGYPSPFAHYPRGPGGFKMALIFDSLLERDEKGLIPWLAESYSISEDGRSYRFTIREGIRWQDNTPLTAEDVVFSLQYANRYGATWSYIHQALASVNAEGRTVTVQLNEPQAMMLDGIGRTRIIPRHIWEHIDNPKEFTTPEAVIGCGPYRLTDYSKEHGTYRFEAFADYWGNNNGARPRVKVIEFVPVSEPILAYENRELDMVAVPPDVLPRFTADPANKIIRDPAFWGYRLLFNMERQPALKDVHVRRALALAIDRQELVDKIARGAAIAGRLSILPPDHVMALPTLTPDEEYAFNPAKARELLVQTNAADGLNLELLCSGQEVRIAELIRQRLGEVGITLSIRAADGKSRDSKVRGRDFQLAILGHGGWGGDADYLSAHLLGDVFRQNASPSASGTDNSGNPELAGLADLLRRQAMETDNATRREILAQIQHLAAELVVEIPLFYTAGYTAYRPATYDGWMNMYDHHSLQHSKLSYLTRSGVAAIR